MRALLIIAAATGLAGFGEAARADFIVSVQEDLVAPPTEAGLTAWNVYVLGSAGDRMAAFNVAFSGTGVCQVWTSVDEAWTPTPYRKDLDIANGKYRNDSHLGYLATELLAPGGDADESNDLSLDVAGGRGVGELACTADLGVINDYQTDSAHLARIVLPQGQTASMDLTVWNENGEDFALGASVVPEPAGLVMLAIGAAGMLRRKRAR